MFTIAIPHIDKFTILFW